MQRHVFFRVESCGLLGSGKEVEHIDLVQVHE